MWIWILAANLFWAFALITIGYSWGYDQCAIDGNIAYFSRPAYLNFINGIPWLLGTLVFGGLGILFYRKSNIIEAKDKGDK